MPEFNETVDQRRNRIAELLMAQEVAAAAPPATEIFPHSPTSAFTAPDIADLNDPSMANPNDASVTFGMPSPADTSITSPSIAAQAAFGGFASPATAANTYGGRDAGNLFEGSFDPFGGAYDPGSPAPGSTPSISISPTAPAPGFGPNQNAPADYNPNASRDVADLGALGDPSGNAADPSGDNGNGDNSGSEGASSGVG